MANKTRKVDGTAAYEPVKSGCQVGQSQCWMYGVGGVLEVLIETAEIFIPSRTTGDPLEATVSIREIDNGASKSRTSDPVLGRYYRLLERGTYTVEVSLEGYQTRIVPNVEIVAGPLQELDIQLSPNTTSRKDLGNLRNQSKSVTIYPNPFASQIHFRINADVQGFYQLSILNQLGQVIAIPLDENLSAGQKTISWDAHKQFDQAISQGIYFYILRKPGGLSSCRNVVRLQMNKINASRKEEFHIKPITCRDWRSILARIV